MTFPITSSSSNPSPRLSITLSIAGMQQNVAEVGPGFLVLRNAVKTEPADGVLHIEIESNALSWNVQLPEGIEPSSDRQTLVMLSHLAPEIAGAR